jgi:Flp pilus assembly pilin Flp
MLKKFLNEFVKDEAGQDIVEYSLLLTLIGATSVFVLTMMGLSVSRLFGSENAFIRGYSSLTVEKSKMK